ncbi:twin-arginine translocase subunit TatC [Bacillus cytotoxicus]|uniref:Sec-independent protein translocase protein TatC n=2 Tax=Bacillus cytotoxicus TaxID=580165 RepID=A0AAX2CG43_9BACI|nr:MULTISPECIES: twin-arginine translocase subunit TatC [Bacillus cereus group]ABS21955.1 Sec-independent protein translocase, TatC subunit [Bacillus cytotoxicus NVH 391-98]AWC30816.1 twin-arginine translocase subunit TatC [Bacillus cytotoxicus]AWC34874.1 twin-arginine translocase subunit TatC [Bacillus cytotoxicus]AWC38872.1 twin-arginine translocase subunit TatC [Bacillus cytotoxicus]AWC42937.1 twin-arginine translocase subunit TatC [Bacillus cytotoxicus]
MEDREMSIVEHIVELRKRLIITVLSFIVFLIVGFVFTKDIYFWLVKDLPMKLTVLGPSDVLWIFFSIATVFAIVCTIPIATMQIWLFVKPGLHPREQKMTLMYIPVLFVLFIAGLCFGYFIVMPFLFHFLTTIGNEMFYTMFTTEKYFHFVLNLTIPFAVIFELPVIVMFLTSIGLLTAEFLQKVRRYAYVILIILAACISPPDFLSHSLVAVPLICIYEISIAISKFTSRRKQRREEIHSKSASL